MNKTEKSLPGEELVEKGLADLAANRMTESSLLLLIAAPRLRLLGLQVPQPPFPKPYEHTLYTCIEDRLGPAAHSHYNSLIRRIVSYARALVLLTADMLRASRGSRGEHRWVIHHDCVASRPSSRGSSWASHPRSRSSSATRLPRRA